MKVNRKQIKPMCKMPRKMKKYYRNKFVDMLKEYDEILIAGEALSHCVANTIRDTAKEFSDDQVKKFVLLENATSCVTGCEKFVDDFVNEMVTRGLRISQTTKFFK